MTKAKRAGGEGQKNFPKERVPELGLGKQSELAKGIASCFPGTGRDMCGGTEAKAHSNVTELLRESLF